uniref:Uncharacterized protein n=1 Tax=Anopheles minimus TaxID=112268 RepID=A0A182WAR6_9DIPT
MQFTNLRLLWVPISLMALVQQIAGQFKIVNLNAANLTYPSNGTTRSVNFVQIKPIVIANSSASTELQSTKSSNESGRALQQEKMPTMMVENKFIKLSIVNSTAMGNRTRERKIQQTRQNELPSDVWSKTPRLQTNTKFSSVVGYAKKSKTRSTTQTAMDPPNKSTAESSKVRRNKYRNFKSRCRCE